MQTLISKHSCLLLLAIALTPSSISSQSITGELKKWHKVTLTYDGPTTSELDATNPFSDYSLIVTFINDQDTFCIPGYYAGDGDAAETSSTMGNKWKVHFSPSKVGTWDYKTCFTTGTDVAINGGGDPVTSVNGIAGSIIITESDKSGKDFRGKGRLEYVGEHYLQFSESGEWFVKGGSDAPENTLAYEDFDDVPNKGGRRKNWTPHQQDYIAAEAASFTWQNGKGSELLGVINYLSSKNVNAVSFLTYSLAGDDQNVFPHLLKVDESTYNSYNQDQQWNQGVHKDRFDVSRLAQWERIFEYADQKGIYLHFKTQETENDQRMDDGDLGRERKLYYRELIARFSHHLALNWNIGEENTNTTAQRIDFADYISSIDPYRNNIVIHTYPGEKNSVHTPLLGSASTYTGLSMQTSNNTFNEVFSDVDEWVTKSSSAGKKWVVAVDEPGNASIGIDSDPDDIELVRNKVVWPILMAGGAGVEYYYGYQSGCGDLQCQDHRSRDDKYTELSYALRFFQDFFQPYLPIVEEARDITTVSTDFVLANPGNAYALYSPDGASSDITLPTGNWQVQWYNPRTGVMTNTIDKIDGSVTPPDNNDWVGLVTQCQSRILFVRGGPGTGGFFEGGSDEQLADINNTNTNGGNHGWGELAMLLSDEGYIVEQVIEGVDIPIDFTTLDLSLYSTIVFGSNNAAYANASIDSVESFIRKGGSALFISDANFGSDWPDAPDSDQHFLDRFGWTMNQDQGTYGISSNEFVILSHPIFTNVNSFDGEGVSPITLSDSTVAGVSSTILARAKGQVRRNNNQSGQGTSEQSTDLDAALIIATVDKGRIAGHFDRNTFFNLNGAGTNIQRLSNTQYTINLFSWLTDCLDTPAPCTTAGDPCNDGDACTINDVLDADCNCIGAFQDTDMDSVCDADDNCPDFDNTLIGTSCDDGDPATSGDIYTSNCICEGNAGNIQLQLIDANTDLALRFLNTLDTINLVIDGADLNISAIFNTSVGSVRFGLDDNDNFNTENVSPYALGGDSGGDYNIWNPTLGLHTLTTTGYSGMNATGSVVVTRTIQFLVVEGCSDEVDSDEDGIGNDCDNCPSTNNPNQEDSNQNGIGDVCELGCQPRLVINAKFSSGAIHDYKAAGDINSNSLLESGSELVFRAGGFVEMMPGFDLQTGALLEAIIEQCVPE